MKASMIFFITGLLMVVSAPVLAERMTDNWILTGYTKYRDGVFADKSRLSSSSPGVSAIWIKVAPSSRSPYLRAIKEYLQSVHKQTPGFRSIEILCEVDCSVHLIRFMKFVYLDGNRHVIYETYEGRPAWIKINPGSIWHPVEKVACAEMR